MLWRSTDGGSNWSDITSDGTNELHVDMHAIAFAADSSKMYVGNDGGVWSTANLTGTVTWTNLNASATDATKSLAILQFYPGMAITSPTYIFGGTQDNGSQLFTGNVVWNEIACGDGGWSAIDPGNNNIVYTACNDLDVEKSTNNPPNWNSFSQVMNGLPTDPNAERVAFIPPMVMDPINSAILYFGTYRLYRTANGAGSWTLVGNGNDLTGGIGFCGGASAPVISTIAVSPVAHTTVWVGTCDGKVQVTANADQGASATFSDRTSTLPTRTVTQIAVDPTDNTGNTVYATFSGFTVGSDTKGHVFKTTNGGTSWNDVSGNLPNTPVNDIVVDPVLPNTVYIGTDVGVFYTTNANAGPPTWNTLVVGLPKVAVLSLKLHAASRTLVAGTHGRSAWSVLLGSPISLQPSPVSFGNRLIYAYATIPVTLANDKLRLPGPEIPHDRHNIAGLKGSRERLPKSGGFHRRIRMEPFHPFGSSFTTGRIISSMETPPCWKLSRYWFKYL